MNGSMKTDFTIDDIYKILRKEILTLSLKPGEIISENTMSKRFGVSRTPIRNVIERLRTDYLVFVLPKKGTFVSLIDLDMAEQIIYLRSQIEFATMSRIAKRPNSLLFDKLELNLMQQSQMLKGEVDSESFYKVDSRFHEQCMTSVGKRKIWQLISDLDVHYSRYRRMDYITSQKYEDLYKEHSHLLELMKQGASDELLHYTVTAHLYGGILRIGDNLVAEYKDYFVEGDRTIEEIILDVKQEINELHISL